jgi:heme/copper-type cytochrome/quinol oxidase subunit 1
MGGLIKIIVGLAFVMFPVFMLASAFTKPSKQPSTQDQFKQEWASSPGKHNDVQSDVKFGYDKDKHEASMKIHVEITPRRSLDSPSDYSAPMVSTTPDGGR